MSILEQAMSESANATTQLAAATQFIHEVIATALSVMNQGSTEQPETVIGITYDIENNATDGDVELGVHPSKAVIDEPTLPASDLDGQVMTTAPAKLIPVPDIQAITDTAYQMDSSAAALDTELALCASESADTLPSPSQPELATNATPCDEEHSNPAGDEATTVVAAAVVDDCKVCTPCGSDPAAKTTTTDRVQEAERNFHHAHRLTNAHEVQAAFILHKKHPLNDAESLRLFELLDVAKTGKVTMADIEQATSRYSSGEAHGIIYKYRDTPLAHLRDRRATKMIFNHIDAQQTGGISLAQWKAFLAELMLHDHDYLRRKGLSDYRAYFGKGYAVATPAPASDEESGAVAEMKGVSAKPITPEASAVPTLLFSMMSDFLLPHLYALCGRDWLEDFVYYQKNHHPLLGLLYADTDNPLTKVNRLQIEFVVNSYNLFASTIVYTMSGSTVGLYLLSIAIVSLPMVVMRNFLLQLFTCPCLQLRNRHPRCCKRCCVNCLRSCGYGIGTAYALGGVAFLVFGILTCLHFGSGFVLSWLFAWGLSYIICILADVCLPFNCMSVCLWIMRNKYGCLAYLVLRRMGLGSWQLQKERVLRALAERRDKAQQSNSNKDASALEVSDEDEPEGSWKDSGRDYFTWRFWGDNSSRAYKYSGYKQTQVLPV